jgi:transmembrane sensor
MADNIEQFRLLVQRHIDNQLTEQEEEDFFSLIQHQENRLLLQQVVDEQFQLSQVTGPSISPRRLQQIRDHILASKPTKQVRLFTLRRIAVAAAVLFIAGTVYFWRVYKQGPDLTQVHAKQPADVAPGGKGAILTLADGTKIVLDSMGNGVIATQNGAQAVLKDGRLTYLATDNAAENITYNTMTTPKGRQFHVQLPDGTQAWLNAASSITYPTTFNDNSREVAITGEVYFEVAHQAVKGGSRKIPFIVKIYTTPSRLAGSEVGKVEVLGTHFNVNAYEHAAGIRTTLLEGKVRVSSMVNRPTGRQVGEWSILKPGEQAIASSHSPLTIDHTPDISQVMAWKNGHFNFNGNDIRSVMNEIARWYDLEVIYESEPPSRQIVGEIQRDLTLSQVMTVLKKLNINYRLEGRTLIITK